MKLFNILLIVLVIIMILIIIYFIIGNYFFNISLNSNTSKTFVLGENKEKNEEELKRIEDNQKWLSKHSKDVYIYSDLENLKLHAYEIKNEKETNKWSIVIHGYMGEGKLMTTYAKEFYVRGYNILIIDLRSHGLSEGKYIGMGWPDRIDVISWSNYIIRKDKNSKIILFGISMGASTVMMATGEDLPKNIKLAIEDCGYTSIWDEFKYQLKNLFNLPSFPVLNSASIICKIKFGYKFKDASSIEQLKKSKIPILFIHGSKDTFVPFEMLEKLYQIPKCDKKMLVIEGAGHAQSANTNYELYWNTIDKFIEKYF